MHCGKKIGNLQIICKTLIGFPFLFVANYEFQLDKAKILKKCNKQLPPIFCMLIGGYCSIFWIFCFDQLRFHSSIGTDMKIHVIPFVWDTNYLLNLDNNWHLKRDHGCLIVRYLLWPISALDPTYQKCFSSLDVTLCFCLCPPLSPVTLFLMPFAQSFLHDCKSNILQFTWHIS